MVRTQIQLTDEQARHVKRLAAEQQVSMATVIRQGVDLLLRSAETAVTDDERMNARSRWPDNSDPAAAMEPRNMISICRRPTAGERLRRYLRAVLSSRR